MKDDDDDQVNHLLRNLAPPERDPLFRIRVLERRERRQFVRRVALLVGAGVIAGVAYAFAIAGSGTNEVAHGLGLAVAAVVAAVIYVPALLMAVRGMRR